MFPALPVSLNCVMPFAFKTSFYLSKIGNCDEQVGWISSTNTSGELLVAWYSFEPIIPSIQTAASTEPVGTTCCSLYAMVYLMVEQSETIPFLNLDRVQP